MWHAITRTRGGKIWKLAWKRPSNPCLKSWGRINIKRTSGIFHHWLELCPTNWRRAFCNCKRTWARPWLKRFRHVAYWNWLFKFIFRLPSVVGFMLLHLYSYCLQTASLRPDCPGQKHETALAVQPKVHFQELYSPNSLRPLWVFRVMIKTITNLSAFEHL